MHDLKPAWKVALQTLGVAFLIVIIAVAVDDNNDPNDMLAAMVVFAPLVAYVIQKTRIDSANAKNKP